MNNNKLIQQAITAANNLDVELVEVVEYSSSYFGCKIRIGGETSQTIIGSKSQYEQYEFCYQSFEKEKQHLLTKNNSK